MTRRARAQGESEWTDSKRATKTKTSTQKKSQTTIQRRDTSNNNKIKKHRRHDFETFDKIPKQKNNKNNQNSLVICVFLLIILTAPQLQRDSYKKKDQKVEFTKIASEHPHKKKRKWRSPKKLLTAPQLENDFVAPYTLTAATLKIF